MPSKDPAEAGGLVVIRVWVEPGAESHAGDRLRARITTARDPDLASEETHTVAGAAGVIAVIEGFLSELGGAAAPRGEGETLG